MCVHQYVLERCVGGEKGIRLLTVHKMNARGDVRLRHSPWLISGLPAVEVDAACKTRHLISLDSQAVVHRWITLEKKRRKCTVEYRELCICEVNIPCGRNQLRPLSWALPTYNGNMHQITQHNI